MPHATQKDTEAPGHDSFLDVVANMVGILIILVMVVGVRVKNAPVVAAIASGETRAQTELGKELAIEQSLRRDVLQAADEIRNLQSETLVRARQRHALATAVAAGEHQIEARRGKMDAELQRDFDLKRSLSESRSHLDQLEHQRAHAQTAPADPILVESYPTPLSQTVDGREAHFQLRGGRIAPIPLDELVDRLKADARRQKYKLLDLPELTDTIGPLGGFRLKYTFRRHDISPEMAVISGQTGSYARLERWTLIPVSSQLGEPVEVALAEGSELRRTLSKFHPNRDTVTIWTYPDSFAAFRQIKKELYRLGFSAAARPLPHGIPISGSPKGSKSAAE